MNNPVEITVRVDDVVRDLREARRLVRSTERGAVREAGEATILPPTLSLTPHFIRPYVHVRADWGGGYLTIFGRRRFKNAGGLLNFGGVRRDVIRAKPGSALNINGKMRSTVTGERRYKPMQFLERGRDRGLPSFIAELRGHIMRAFGGMAED